MINGEQWRRCGVDASIGQRENCDPPFSTKRKKVEIFMIWMSDDVQMDLSSLYKDSIGGWFIVCEIWFENQKKNRKSENVEMCKL